MTKKNAIAQPCAGLSLGAANDTLDVLVEIRAAVLAGNEDVGEFTPREWCGWFGEREYSESGLPLRFDVENDLEWRAGYLAHDIETDGEWDGGEIERKEQVR